MRLSSLVKRAAAFVMASMLSFSAVTAMPVAAAQSTETNSEAADSASSEAKYVMGKSVAKYNLEGQKIPVTAGQKVVNKIKVGWNLGNTFDTSNCSWLSNELDYETGWGVHKTTKELISLVKAQGFNAIRIPVSWHNHVSGSDYKISDAWLNRVQEVVDWCIEEDMYVIINIHHDNDISSNSKAFFYPSKQYLNQSEKYVKAIWKQIAVKFKDYSQKLIFESLNEPRLIGSNYEWWFNPNAAECQEAAECINVLNQDFVDVVRATGGKNKYRFLMVPGYGGSVDGITNKYFEVPKDTVKQHLILNCHNYAPYSFALQKMNEGGVKVFKTDSAEARNTILAMMKNLYNKYVSKGQPVMIDEFGAFNKENNTTSRTNLAKYYIAAGKAYGISCFWWDNEGFSASGNEESFGLFDRKNLTVKFPKIVKGLKQYAKVLK